MHVFSHDSFQLDRVLGTLESSAVLKDLLNPQSYANQRQQRLILNDIQRATWQTRAMNTQNNTPASFRTRYASRIRRFSKFRFTARLKNLFGTLIRIRPGRSLPDTAAWSAVDSC